MRRKAYRGIGVNDVAVDRLLEGKEGRSVVVGVDVGKHRFLSVCRWSDGVFERPWKVSNPSEIGVYVRLLQRVGQGRQLVVAMESSGTYGDGLRQALADAGIGLERVSGKAAHDYAEAFDGVPSQHDGKDAAVVSELAWSGKSAPWPYQAADDWEQELTYWVDWLVAQRQLLGVWQGRLEGLLGRHWPEATGVLKLSSVTLLRVLSHYGSPEALAADGEACVRLRKWGGPFLQESKIQRLLAAARTSVGVRMGTWEKRRLQTFAEQALAARREGKRGERQVRRLARGHEVLEGQGKVVGVPTACVLWVHTGDPRKYYAAGAYRKALGLNLVERSSGEFKSALHISKRGSARSRQWLYFAALRQVQKAGVRGWYEAQKARDPEGALRVVVALMRKLALALYQVGVQQQEFNVRRLFAQAVSSAKSEPQDTQS
jgi:transposase